MKSTILMYHSVTDQDIRSIPPDEQLYTITLAEFERQLDYLRAASIRSCMIDSQELESCRPLVITFDDGHASDVDVALPRLLSMNMQAEFYITTGWIGKKRYLSKSAIRELTASGMKVGTHGVTHQYFDDLTECELRRELVDSKHALEDIIGDLVDSGSAPGGRLHPSTADCAADSGYHYICTSRAGRANLSPAETFRLLPRFAVTRNMQIRRFANLVNGHSSELILTGIKSLLLDQTKQILGNKTYEKLRRRILSLKTLS